MTTNYHTPRMSPDEYRDRLAVAGDVRMIARELERIADALSELAWNRAGSLIVYPENHAATVSDVADYASTLAHRLEAVADAHTPEEAGR